MAPIIFKANPVRAISIIFIRFVPNIMAFGGVAIGSIKAIEADSVAGSMNRSGLICVLTESPANTGNNISVVATLEVSSVRKVIIRH